MISVIALSDLVGAPVRDLDGRAIGRAMDLAVVPQEHPNRVAYLVARIGTDDRLIPAALLASVGGGVVRLAPGPDGWALVSTIDHLLLLKRDLLDQQIIDVHGRKVVRVNDVDLDAIPAGDRVTLLLQAVDVGARGAVRRLAHGIVPPHTLRSLLARIPSRAIPWFFVDLLEVDPSRRVKLKIVYQGLSSLHPADIADIVEELPAAEREAVFETIDTDVAAETLEELDRDVQVSVVESLDSERAADIVEQMDPAAAADLLGDLPEAASDVILEQMAPQERHEVGHLLEFDEHTAAGRMTTEFLAVPAGSCVRDAVEALRGFEGGIDSVAMVYLTDEGDELVGVVPLVRALLVAPETPLRDLTAEAPVSCLGDTPDDQVAELFDKYNLFALPVVDEHRRLAGVIRADDVINYLRNR